MFQFPISEDTLRHIGKKYEQHHSFDFVDTLSIPELSALIVVQKFGQGLASENLPAKEKLHALENQLADMLQLSQETDRSELCSITQSQLRLDQLYEGCRRVKSLGAGFMLADQVSDREFIHPDGSWNWDYKKDYFSDLDYNSYQRSIAPANRKFTRDQNRIINIFSSEPDESLDVQGFAGTGKTALISLLVDSLNESRVLLLAMTWPQLQAMSHKLNKQVAMHTFAQMADEARKSKGLQGYRIEEFRTRLKYIKSPYEIAQLMGYNDLDGMTSNFIAQLVNQTVKVFCHTADQAIDAKHLPKNYRHVISEHNKPIIINLAKQYWQELVTNENGSNLPASGYHRVKLWSLTDGQIPLKYTHIIIDETHDLPAPVIHVLDQSSQSVITFGDTYQVLDHRGVQNKRGGQIRHKTMSNSFRAGENTNDLFNQIILSHPNQPEQPFEGRAEHQTRITYFEGDALSSVSDRYCTILAKSSWHVFDIMTTLASESAAFHIFQRTLKDMTWLVQGAIEFYQQGEKPKHSAFFRYRTWDDFYAAQPTDVSQIIDRTILKGFGYRELEAFIGMQVQTVDPSKAYLLGKVSDAKNHEFERVLILDDTLEAGRASKEDFGLALNTLYTGISRAKNELFIPAHIEGWVQDTKKQAR